MSSSESLTNTEQSLSRTSFYILIAGILANTIGQSFIFAILPPLGREVALTEVQTTSIISASALLFTFCSPWWGRQSDRVGRKIVIVIGLTGYAAGTLVFAGVFALGMSGVLSGTILYITLMLARCGQSSLMAATSPGVTAYAADHTSRALRTRTLARLGTANSLGFIIGPVIAGVLAGFGLLVPLYVAAALTFAAVFVLWRRLPEAPKETTSHTKVPRLSVFDTRLRVYLLSAVGTFTAFSAVQQTLGFRIQDSLSLDGIETAQYTGAALMVSAFFTLVLQLTVAQRYSGPALHLIRYGLAAKVIGCVVISIGASPAMILAGMSFIGAGLGLLGPAISAGGSLAVSRDEQGGAAGLISACPAAGFIVGPLLGGMMYQVNPGYPSMFAVVLLASVLAYALTTSSKAQSLID